MGIASLDELLSKTREKRDRDELALRLLIPREELIHWIEKAQLVQLKGLGVENLRLIEAVGIHSISALAAQDPDTLYETMENHLLGSPHPNKAKIRIWIREAKKQLGVKSYEL